MMDIMGNYAKESECQDVSGILGGIVAYKSIETIKAILRFSENKP